jgi:hypothetical protein
MVNKWPFITVASVINSLSVTGAFINFKSDGISMIDPQHAGSWLYTINPSLFAAGMFLFTFLAIIAMIYVARFISAIIGKLHTFNKSLATPTP